MSLQLSQPSPPHAPRLEVIGPHFEKIFLPDRWNPLHILRAPDTGPPHDHPYTMNNVKIVRGGYRETVWVLTLGGGYKVHRDIVRLPGTMHTIAADTIHLITDLLDGFSISEPEPEEARRDWFFYLPQDDGSVLRSSNYDGPWLPYHPAGPVIDGTKVRLVAAGTIILKPQLSFTIGFNNSWNQAKEALKEGHQVRLENWAPNSSWILERNTENIMVVEGKTKAEWAKSARQVRPDTRNLVDEKWTVLPIIDHEKPTI